MKGRVRKVLPPRLLQLPASNAPGSSWGGLKAGSTGAETGAGTARHPPGAGASKGSVRVQSEGAESKEGVGLEGGVRLGAGGEEGVSRQLETGLLRVEGDTSLVAGGEEGAGRQLAAKLLRLVGSALGVCVRAERPELVAMYLQLFCWVQATLLVRAWVRMDHMGLHGCMSNL